MTSIKRLIKELERKKYTADYLAGISVSNCEIEAIYDEHSGVLQDAIDTLIEILNENRK
jgi:hypothetical protein